MNETGRKVIGYGRHIPALSPGCRERGAREDEVTSPTEMYLRQVLSDVRNGLDPTPCDRSPSAVGGAPCVMCGWVAAAHLEDLW